MMRIRIIGLLAAVAAMFACTEVSAQDNSYDVFNPISKYLALGMVLGQS